MPSSGFRPWVDALESQRAEPIAIIGLGCRFPGGATSPEEYWRVLRKSRPEVARMVRESSGFHASVAGIFHWADALRDSVLTDPNWEGFWTV
jgi:acyl transferase domain-containing protein